MKQKLERVMRRDEHGNLVPEKHLYRRKYDTAAGRTSIFYYAIFTDWKGIRRRFPLGEHLDRARNKLGELHKKNDAEFDLDKARADRVAREMTFKKWAEQCQNQQTIEDKARVRLHLEPFFGDKPLEMIDDAAVIEYREKRSKEKIIKHKKESKKIVSPTTINKEVRTLSKLLELGRKKGFAHRVTEFKTEPETARNRVLSTDEYRALLDHSPAWLRRACVMAWETCLSRSDLLGLTWSEIDLENGYIVLKNGRNKTGALQGIPIDTEELNTLLAELQTERRARALADHRLPNVEEVVLTMDGQRIRTTIFEYWFRASRKAAGIKNFKFHDFRHCAITRWATTGVAPAAAMIMAGHKSAQSHKRYQNLQLHDVKAALRNSLRERGVNTQKIEKQESAASA